MYFTTTSEALAYFDKLPPISVEDILGDWQGEEIATGHPMDGMLAATNWFGKSFHSADAVDPLVHESPRGRRFCVNPAFLPLKLGLRLSHRRRIVLVLFAVLRPFITTQKPKARLRMIMFRGKLSAAMIYDAKPIIDVFRKVDDDTVVGLMDQRGVEAPYFFRMSRL